MDQVVGVELDSLKDHVIEYVEREECRVEKNAGVGIIAEELVVVGRAGKGVEHEHRPADHVEVHLHVEAFVEEGQLESASFPQGQERVLDLALRLTEDCKQRKKQAEHRPAGHRVNCRAVEPVARHAGKFKRPNDHGDSENKQAVQPVIARLAGVGVNDVTGDPARGQDYLGQKKHRKHRQRRKETREGFGPGEIKQVVYAEPVNHGQTSIQFAV